MAIMTLTEEARREMSSNPIMWIHDVCKVGGKRAISMFVVKDVDSDEWFIDIRSEKFQQDQCELEVSNVSMPQV